jgi:hypothetical protein
VRARAGAVRVALTRLAAGRYRLALAATDAAGNTARVTRTVRIG